MQVECIKTLLYVADMSRAVRFYRDVMGLNVKLETPGWSEVTRGDAIIGLHAGGDGSQKITELSFQVADVDAALREIERGGERLIETPQARPGEPFRLGSFADPEGNVVMITQYIGG